MADERWPRSDLAPGGTAAGSTLGDPMEAWKARGRDLNAIYDTLSSTMQRVLPYGGAPTAQRCVEAACTDIEALGAEVERLRGLIGELYVGRGGNRFDLYNAIKRAFRDSGAPGVECEPEANA